MAATTVHISSNFLEYNDTIGGTNYARLTGTADGTVTFSSSGGTGGFVDVAGVYTTPATANSAASKAYVDSLAVTGVTWKNAARLATDGNETGTTYVYNDSTEIAVTGNTAIDGIQPADGDRILFKDTSLITGGTAADATGIYEVSNYILNTSMTLTRTSDAANGTSANGNAIFIFNGDSTAPLNNDTTWVVTNDAAVTYGGAVVWTQMSAAPYLGDLTQNHLLVGDSDNKAVDAGTDFTFVASGADNTLNIGTATANENGTVALGNQGGTGTSTITMNGDTVALNSDSDGAAVVSMFAANTTGNMNMGSGLTSGTLTLGNATAGTGTITVDGDSSQIDIGPTTTGAVNVGSSAAGAVSLDGSSTMTIAATSTSVDIGSSSSTTTDLFGVAIDVGSTDTTSLDLLATGIAGAVNITGGDATSSGTVSISTTSATTATVSGGEIDITAGDGNTTGTGGAIDINAGAGGATDASVGGAITINSGASTATNGDGGNVTITAAAATGTGTDGSLDFNVAGVSNLWPNADAGGANYILTKSNATAQMVWTAPGGASMLALPEDQIYIGNAGTADTSGTSATFDRSTLTTDPTFNLSGTGNTETNTVATMNFGTVGGATVAPTLNMGLGAVASTIAMASTGANNIDAAGSLTVDGDTGLTMSTTTSGDVSLNSAGNITLVDNSVTYTKSGGVMTSSSIMTLESSDGSASAGSNFTINTGAGDGDGNNAGSFNITSGNGSAGTTNGNNGGNSGTFIFSPGNGGAGFAGTGTNGGTGGTGGGYLYRSGLGAVGGNADLANTGGNGGNGGTFTVNISTDGDGGDGGTTATGTGGTGGNGGSFIFGTANGGDGGAATGAGTGGTGGTGANVTLNGGAGGAGGNSVGGTNGTGGDGGTITLAAGSGGAVGTGGSGGAAGTDGNIVLTTGAGNTAGGLGTDTSNIISFNNTGGIVARMESDGTFYGTGFQTTSDATHKENITRLNDPLARIRKVEGYSYNWKSDYKGYNNRLEYGVTAQQLKEAGFDNLVGGGQTEGDMTVNYLGLIPVLIEALKESDMQVQNLTLAYGQLIKDLQSEVEFLKNERRTERLSRRGL